MACDNEKRYLNDLISNPPPECGPPPQPTTMGGQDPGYDSQYRKWQNCMLQRQIWRSSIQQAREKLDECLTATRLETMQGYVESLRVTRSSEDVYGGGDPQSGGSNPIKANVVFRLHEYPKRAFGYVLDNVPFDKGMLDVLRDALSHELRVRVDAIVPVSPPNQNAIVVRVEAVKWRRPETITSPGTAGQATIGL